MVFINRSRELINLFKVCSRSEIGTALLAYEEYLCKDLDVSDEALKRLQDIFDFYDERYSDDYPSLANEVLQSPVNIIFDMFGDFEKDGYNFDFHLGHLTDDTTSIEVVVSDRNTGYTENELDFDFENKTLDSNNNDTLNIILKATQEVRKRLEKKPIEKIINSYNL